MNRRRFVANIANSSLVLSVIPAAPLLVGSGCASAARRAGITVNDEDGSLGRSEAPIHVAMSLNRDLLRSASEGTLVATEIPPSGPSPGLVVPIQTLQPPADGPSHLVWRLPPGPAGSRRFLLAQAGQRPEFSMVAQLDPGSGQYLITDSGQPVLRYNYATIEPGAFLDTVATGNRKYAVARSNYIHPLWGPHGEELTQDWSVDHPHHRGIYWAWPEVDWHGQQGDLHALQLVFARPTGRCATSSGPLFAQIDADNIWKWQGGEEIVHERAIIRAWRKTRHGRLLDLEFHFTALQERVLLARRGTDKYGGLNIRLAAVREQQIFKHLGPPDSQGQPAWADLSGVFPGASNPAGVTILQHSSNPDYPGDWVEYPELNWLQPTFPRTGTRFALEPGRPLVLRFRLWIHAGTTPAPSAAADQWQAMTALTAPPVLTRQ